VEKTGSVGSVQKEASYINKSLSFLEQVVVALTHSKRDHIPYRQSKLTFILKDSLGGNCHTFMIACAWQHHQHMLETLSTLRFVSSNA
jgi:kinesin family member 6/9